ncbi:MAG: ATP-grasp domain-containing protein [Rickettsiaceae bacterium H1]|nr:ATP-grasp domain-containing protein [Rickettsiaceae bacterium H1]
MKKILIANRGEIACRIIKTLHKMKIKSVAVFSEADVNSLHVEMADESFCIGPAASIKSYLNIDAICDVALESKADGVHPGFGFLSENCEFARRLKEVGVNFIGPSDNVIKIMGDKIEAKKIAAEAGVNIIDGYMDLIDDTKKITAKSESIGFPVIIKAAAGGGGKGMRIINSAEEVEEALALAGSEAAKSFGDDRVFIEKYIEKPRHIEIQILSDKHGNIICLGERECSIQRRYQKVIEEAPSCFITDKVREKMYEQSIMLAQKVGYYSVGTVEFIVDRNKNFYFLEMNTRIQVEHPVTELVTGFDLIEQMIKIEKGEKLNIKQSNVFINGHAIEVRVYAEDPTNNFLPASGVITRYIEPCDDNVRIDSGIGAGSEITMFYDPMLAKICTYGKNRKEAISAMKLALRKFYILGIVNNVSFLQSIISHPQFISGNLYTGFIQDFYPEGLSINKLTKNVNRTFCAVILYIHLTDEYRKNKMFGEINLQNNWLVEINHNTYYEVNADYLESGIKMEIEGNTLMLNTNWIPGNDLFIANIDDNEIIVKLNKVNFDYILEYDGSNALCKVYRPDYADLLKFIRSRSDEEDNSVVLSPITGMITKIYVSKGEEVTSGQPLFVIEAMKMENTFYAKAQAIVSDVKYSEGDNISSGDIIIEY